MIQPLLAVGGVSSTLLAKHLKIFIYQLVNCLFLYLIPH